MRTALRQGWVHRAPSAEDHRGRHDGQTIPIARSWGPDEKSCFRSRLSNPFFSAYNFLVRDELPKILETHHQFAILNRCFQFVHASQRRAADTASVRGVDRAMARADEFLFAA